MADQAGGGWAARARELALAFSSSVSREDSAGVMVLTDLHSLFEGRKTDRLSSEDIVKALAEMEERPWPEWKNGKAMTSRQLARLLHRFGIKPKQLWIGQKSRGYELDDFKDAFTRYLPPIPVGSVGSDGGSSLNPAGDAVGLFGDPVESPWNSVISSPDDDSSAVPPAPTGAKRKPTGSTKISEANSCKGYTEPTDHTGTKCEVSKPTLREILNQSMVRAKADREAWSFPISQKE